MFKKFKDKLAEEMKQSPARLQASMQQLAQAVVSPALSNSSIQELSASNDNFSLTEECDETPKNSPARHGFQNVDLTSPISNSHGISRRSSVSSVASIDTASLFPIYESPGNMYHLQSDMEQSASEVDDNISPQLDRVSKDQLYAAYRKVQTKYHKYRGRYTDLANHYREMERVKGKLESLLVETQDKALRRIADLKEQCQLEQQAKAHLEEALRNDIEEKDHVIDTLNTKVRLLQAGGPVDAALSSSSLDESNQIENHRIEQLIDVSTEVTSSSSQPSESETSSSVTSENTQLKLKLEKLESLITKYKESLKRNKEKMSEITLEKSIIERDFEVSRNSSTERFNQLEDDLNVARNEIIRLRDEMTAMRKREEESVISLAENKLTIHRELEVKEEQIKELRKELKAAEELRRELKLAKESRVSLEESVERYKMEIESLKMSNEQSTDAEKADLVRDLSKGKTEALKLMQKEMQRRVIELEETIGAKCHEEEAKNRELIDKLERREEDLRSFERETIELRKEAENYRIKCEELRNELSTIKDKEYRDEIGNRNADSKRNEATVKDDATDSKTIDDKVENQGKEEKVEENFQEKGAEDSKQAEYIKKADNHYKIEWEKLRDELSTLKNEFELLKTESEELKKCSKQAQEKTAILENSAAEKDETIRQLNDKIDTCTTTIERAKERLEKQQSEIKNLRDNSENENELMKLREDSENKTVEILGIASELKSCKSTINDLREKIRGDTEKIDLLTREKICLISNVLEYKKKIGELKKNCGDVKTTIVKYGETRNEEMTRIRQIVDDNFAKYSKLQMERNEKEIKELVLLKDKLESELQERNNDILTMREKVNKWDETYRRNDKLIAEIDSLNFKIFDLEKLRITLDETKVEVENLKIENEALKKSVEMSEKIIKDTENRQQIFQQDSTKFGDLELANEELRKFNEQLKIEREEERTRFDEKSANLIAELSKLKAQFEEERENEEERIAIANMEVSKMKAEHENHEKLIADYAEKIKYFEAECAKRDIGLENLGVTMEKREKMLEETIEKSRNLETEITKLSEEKSRLELELVNREKIVNDCNERLKSFEIEISRISEEKSKLIAELENREKSLQDVTVKLTNLEEEFAKLSQELLGSATELEKRDKMLRQTIEKLQNIQVEFAKVTEEKLKIAEELENREKLLKDCNEKLEKLENKCSQLSQEHSGSATELENREKTLRQTIEKLQNIQVEFAKVTEEKLKIAEELENREKLLKDSNEKLEKLKADFSKVSDEKSEISVELENVRTASTEFEGSNEALKETINSKNVLLKKLKALKERQSQTIQDSATKILELETRIKDLNAKSEEFEAEITKNTNLVSKISELEIVVESLEKKIRDFEENSSLITREKENLAKLNEDLRIEISENSLLLEEFSRVKLEHKKSKELCNELEKSNEDLIKMKQDMKMKLEELEKICADRAEEIVNLKNEIIRRDDELKKLGENSGQRLADLEELRIKLEEDYRNRADKLEDEYMEKYRDKEREARSKDNEAELHLRELVQQLQNQLQDKESKLLSSQTTGSQMQILNEELKTQADKLKEEMETNEAEQSMRLKQLVKEFQAQLHDKDEELQAALDKRFESQQNYESELVQQYREQLKDFQVELTTKSEKIESLIIEKKEEMAIKSREMEKLIETIGKIKQEHANDLREVERKWKVAMKQKADQLEAKHDEDVSELTREWQNERRNDEITDKSPEELESTSRVAVAAVQSNTGSLHSLQQTLVSQRRELAELRKLVKLRQDTLEDSTEIEYLRNILYEYMMGRETVVLARVIAAVVKFDQEQTTKILKKEEDKLTLLGSLGLS